MLSRNSDFKICKFDKGREITFLNSKNYYTKLNLIVSDTSKPVEIPVKEHETQPVIKRKLQLLLRSETEKEYGNEVITSLIPTGSVSGKLHGLIKVNNENNPARPVVSMITPEYRLANFLYSIIKHIMPQNHLQFNQEMTF